MRVQLLARELAGVRRVGPARAPVVPVGDDERVEGVRLAVVGLDAPAPARLADRALDGGAETQVGPQAEALDVGVEVLADLDVIGEVRPLARHRQVRELRARPAGVAVQGLVGRRQAARVVEHPDAADPVAALEARHVEPRPGAGLQRGQPGGACAHDPHP